MKLLLNSLLIIYLFATHSVLIFADETDAEVTGEKPEFSNTVRGGKSLSEEEIESKIGRYGEVEEIPEGFEFATAENKLWLDNHLGNITQPTSLYYEFEKSGSYEDGFIDSVFLKVVELNKDGTKNALLDFFTAERKQKIPEGNTTNIKGNPVLGIYMNGDVFDMARITGGKADRYRYFLKQIKVALRETAKIESTTFSYNGKEYQGEKIFFTPYVKDPHRRDFEKFADKYYEIVLSDEIPGKLYQITTIIPDASSETAEPLVMETLKLIDVKNHDS
tara:strand:+ start:890 stop:1720 length:831 start_codon:yes stop_codon:yes gene_type:complete